MINRRIYILLFYCVILIISLTSCNAKTDLDNEYSDFNISSFPHNKQSITAPVSSTGNNYDKAEQEVPLNIINGFDISICDEMLYFVNDYGFNELHKIDINKSEIINNYGDYYWRFLIFDGWIYFIDGIAEGAIWKMKEDGSQKIQLTVDKTNRICLVDNWIYYLNSEDNRLYRLNTLDVNDISEICDDKIDSFIIIKQYIYYICDDSVYRVDINGMGKCKICDDIVPYSIDQNSICYYNGWIYLTSSEDGDLYKMKEDGTNKTMVIKNTSDIIEMKIACIIDNWIYIGMNGSIYKVNIDKVEEKVKICNKGFDSAVFYEDYIYTLGGISETDVSVARVKIDGSNYSELYSTELE